MSSQNTSTITLFKEIHTFFGSAVAGDYPERVEAGEHRLPFAFRVPPTQLPASFEGPYGRVRYEVAAVLIRPQHLNKLTSITITIPSTVDSTDLDLLEECSATASGQAGFWLWKSGHLDVTVTLPKTGYASEEVRSSAPYQSMCHSIPNCWIDRSKVVPITLEITNHSGSGAVLKEVCLKQRVTYRTFNEYVSTFCIVDLVHGNVTFLSNRTRGPMTSRIHRLKFTEQYSHSTRKVSRVINFPIPSTNIMAPSITTAILDVSHVVIVKVSSTAKLSKLVKLQVPIVIAGFPAVYFDNNIMRLSMETLPAYEYNDTSSRRGRESVLSRISREIRRGRSRSRGRSASRRRSDPTGSNSDIGPEWEPEPPPPLPELPPHIRRRSATVSVSLSPVDITLPVNRARGRSVSEGIPSRVLPPVSEQTEEPTGREQNGQLLRPWVESARRRSVVISTGDHGIEGEFGHGACVISAGTPIITVSSESPVAEDFSALEDIVELVPPVTDIPPEESTGETHTEPHSVVCSEVSQSEKGGQGIQVENAMAKDIPGQLSRMTSSDSAVVLKRD